MITDRNSTTLGSDRCARAAPHHHRAHHVRALALAAGLPAAPAPAPALAASTPKPAAAVSGTSTAPDAEALRAAIAGLPDADATAALVRVSSTDGAWRGSAGVHDLESGRAADPDARFQAGSTTKVVTAAVVLQLATEEKVALNTPVQHYLPGLLRAAFEPVTVRQLLTTPAASRRATASGTTRRSVDPPGSAARSTSARAATTPMSQGART